LGKPTKGRGFCAGFGKLARGGGRWATYGFGAGALLSEGAASAMNNALYDGGSTYRPDDPMSSNAWRAGSDPRLHEFLGYDPYNRGFHSSNGMSLWDLL
jgi:hypothetical protein